MIQTIMNNKKILTILISILLAGTLVACASVLKPEITASSIPTQTSEHEQTSLPELTPKPQQTPDPENIPEPDTTTVPEMTPEPGLTLEPDEKPEPKQTSEPEQTPEPDETPEPEQTTVPENISEPKQTPEPDKTSQPQDTSHPGTLRMSLGEVISSVRAYHVADSFFNQPDLVEYEIVDLSELEFYHEFVDSYQALVGLEDVPYRIIFKTETPVKDFCYLAIEALVDDSLSMIVRDTLSRQDALTPDEPFVVNWISIGDIGMFRGISFVDENGITRYFGFNTSGYDGDLYFIEFVPE